mmetsp:Transcript_25022/g.40358  ORF Transcript_25022/g.40358 Transcript_25022/m.40358 type:complete len:99 (-) Transcript_25022:119-415(-)
MLLAALATHKISLGSGQTRAFGLAKEVMREISSSVKSTLSAPMLDSKRCWFVDFGTGTQFRCTCQLSTTWAGVEECLDDISLITGSSKTPRRPDPSGQ